MPVARVWDTGPLGSCGGHTAHPRALTPPRAWGTERLKGARTRHTAGPCTHPPHPGERAPRTTRRKTRCRPSHRPCAPTPGPSQPRGSAARPSGQRLDGRGCQPASPAAALWPSEDPTPGLRTQCCPPATCTQTHTQDRCTPGPVWIPMQTSPRARPLLPTLAGQTDRQHGARRTVRDPCLPLSVSLPLCVTVTHTR